MSCHPERHEWRINDEQSRPSEGQLCVCGAMRYTAERCQCVHPNHGPDGCNLETHYHRLCGPCQDGHAVLRDDVREFRVVQAENGRWFLWQRVGDEEDGFEWNTVGEVEVRPLNDAVTVTPERLAAALKTTDDEAQRRYNEEGQREDWDAASGNFAALLFDELRKERK